MGSRHMQSLARLGRPARIYVVDPSAESLKRAQARWIETGPSPEISIEFLSRIDKLPGVLDAAIVATDASSREAVVEALIRGRRVSGLILEKVLFQDPESLSRVERSLASAGIRAWVNCGRRVWPVYQQIQKQFSGRTLNIRVEGEGWGLACNAIHFLDLAAFLTGNPDFEISTQGLSGQSLPSKRQGIVEFSGVLESRGGGHHVALVCKEGPGYWFSIMISAPGMSVTLLEEEGRLQWGDQTTSTFEVPFQSRLTHLVVKDILDRGDCGLTSYQESVRIHRPFLEVMRSHWRKVGDPQATVCPIT